MSSIMFFIDSTSVSWIHVGKGGSIQASINRTNIVAIQTSADAQDSVQPSLAYSQIIHRISQLVPLTCN
jgi:hypothetical protein